MAETYATVAAWPLDRTIAANDLLDAYADAEAQAHAQAEADAREARKARG